MGWLAPALTHTPRTLDLIAEYGLRSQSFNTPRLLAEAGLTYMCDWVNDELPYRFHTGAGHLVNVPINHELSDQQIITVQQNSADSYVEQMQAAYRLLAAEAERFGGRPMCWACPIVSVLSSNC